MWPAATQRRLKRFICWHPRPPRRNSWRGGLVYILHKIIEAPILCLAVRDRQRLCPHFPNGSAGPCLKKHLSDLSPACKAQVLGGVEYLAPSLQAWIPDGREQWRRRSSVSCRQSRATGLGVKLNWTLSFKPMATWTSAVSDRELKVICLKSVVLRGPRPTGSVELIPAGWSKSGGPKAPTTSSTVFRPFVAFLSFSNSSLVTCMKSSSLRESGVCPPQKMQ
ncbi:hypothetical protein ACVILI_005291 [Mesorhizobium sp. USDA 4775]